MRIFLFTITLLFSISQVSAQETLKGIYAPDFEFWTSASLKYNVNDDFRVSFEQAFRFNQNATSLDVYFTDIDAQYKVSKYFKPHLVHRFMLDEGQFEQRFSFGASGRIYKTKRLEVEYRSRFQFKFGNKPGSDDTWRNRISAGYNLPNSKMNPYFSMEHYLDLNNDNHLAKIRYTLGSSLNMKKGKEMDFFYRFEQDYNTNNPGRYYIIGVSFGLELP